MSTPPSQGDAKAGKPDQLPPIKRDFSRKFYTMTPEDILNNRVGPNDVTVTWFEADGKTIKEQIRVSGYPTKEESLLKEDLQTQDPHKGK